MKIAEAESQERLWSMEVAAAYRDDATIVIAPGDCLETLRTLPDGLVKLIITSPPYNLGKAYEKATNLDDYLETHILISKLIFGNDANPLSLFCLKKKGLSSPSFFVIFLH